MYVRVNPLSSVFRYWLRKMKEVFSVKSTFLDFLFLVGRSLREGLRSRGRLTAMSEIAII